MVPADMCHCGQWWVAVTAPKRYMRKDACPLSELGALPSGGTRHGFLRLCGHWPPCPSFSLCHQSFSSCCSFQFSPLILPVGLAPELYLSLEVPRALCYRPREQASHTAHQVLSAVTVPSPFLPSVLLPSSGHQAISLS